MTDPGESNGVVVEFLDVPNEILLHIFSFLRPTQVISKKKEQRVRLANCALKHPDFSAQKCFISIIENKDRWKDWEGQKKVTALGHSATVDSLHLFDKNGKQYCLSGSRDRSLKLWDVDNIRNGSSSVENPWTIGNKERAHQGWIWNISLGDDSDFYTSSWDSTLKHWKLDGNDITELSSLNIGSAVQCVSFNSSRNEVICTTFGKKVAVVDPRENRIVAEHKLHKRAVIGMAVDGNNIYTSAEDRILMMVDRRNMQKALMLNYSQDAYNSYLSLYQNQILAATSDGNVKMFDANDLRKLQTYKAGNFTRQVSNQYGCHMVMAKQERCYQFFVYTPGIRSERYCASDVLATEPAKFDYSSFSKILAVGNGDSSIMFYIPKREGEE